MNTIIKLNGAERYKYEWMADIGKYLVSYGKVAEIRWSEAQNAPYLLEVTNRKREGLDSMGFVKRGRFSIKTAEQVNSMLGRKLLNEEE